MNLKAIKRKTHQIIIKLCSHRRIVIITVAILSFAVMIVGGLLLNQWAWNNYETINNRSFNNAKTDINKAILETLSGSKISSVDKINSTEQVQTKLSNDIKTYCEVDSLIKWQKVIDQYSSKINNCNQQKELVNQLLDKVVIVTDYLKAEQKLAAIIADANNKTNQNNQPDKWNLVEAFWRQAAADASVLTNSSQFSVIKTPAIGSLTSVADAWRQLSSANDTKNRQQFEDARTNLGKVYVPLSRISDNSKIQVDKLISDLDGSYEKVY